MNPYPRVSLGRILRRAQEPVTIEPSITYKQITVRLFHKGVTLRGEQLGASIRSSRQWRARAGQFILSRIDARSGAIGLVPPELDGAVVTNDFWLFDVDRSGGDPDFLDAYFGTADFVESCKRSSEGTTNRVRLQPNRFLNIEVPLPDPAEQRRIIGRIKELAAKIDEARQLGLKAETDAQHLLLGRYREIIKGATLLPMRAVAPLVRRPVEVVATDEYKELGIRSFGKGTFHKAALTGTELGSKRIFRIEPGDLLFNIVFAWEGAVAVAVPEDAGRVGSHRFLTCVPENEAATSSFLCFHFLTEAGLEQLRQASPGGAGRNRTLGLEALAGIEVPVPTYEKQLAFDAIKSRLDEVGKMRKSGDGELGALLSSILFKAFSGEL